MTFSSERQTFIGSETKDVMKSFTFLLGLLFVLFPEGLLAEAPLRIGVIAPLTGPAADYGVAVRNAIELQRKEQSGRPSTVTYIFEDTQYNAKAAVDSFSRLRNIERVDAIYVWGVVFCEALGPLAEQFALPMIAQCVQGNISKDRKYVFRFANPAADYAKMLWQHARSNSLKKIGLVLTENSYLQLMADSLESEKLPTESIVIIDRYQGAHSDFRSTIAKLRNERIDALAVFLGPGQIGVFHRQLAEQQIQIPILGTNLCESSSEIQLAGTAMNGAVYANNPVVDDFQSKYKNEFGNLSQITFAAYAYDFARLIEGFAPHYSGRKETFVTEFSTRPESSGACGRISIRADGPYGAGLSYPVILKEVTGAGFSGQK